MSRTLKSNRAAWLLVGVPLFIAVTAGVSVVVGAGVKLLVPSVRYSTAVIVVASVLLVWAASIVKDLRSGGWK